MRRRAPPILAFSGPSGAGKTSLLVKLIPALRARGLTVCALKHSGHAHAFDRRGKDSARLREAGARAVALQGPAGLAWFGPPLPGGIRALARLLPGADVILAEGFKDERIPRIEVHRSAVARRFLCEDDPEVLAVVSDVEPPGPVPWFTPGEVEALADLVARFTHSPERTRRRALASWRVRVHPSPRAPRAPRGNEVMPKTTRNARTKGARSAARRAGSGRPAASAGTRRRTSGGATVREAGRKGGRRTLERRGPEFYSRIGRKGGKSSGRARRNAAQRRGSTSRRASPSGRRKNGGRR